MNSLLATLFFFLPASVFGQADPVNASTQFWMDSLAACNIGNIEESLRADRNISQKKLPFCAVGKCEKENQIEYFGPAEYSRVMSQQYLNEQLDVAEEGGIRQFMSRCNKVVLPFLQRLEAEDKIAPAVAILDEQPQAVVLERMDEIEVFLSNSAREIRKMDRWIKIHNTNQLRTISPLLAHLDTKLASKILDLQKKVEQIKAQK